LSNFAKNESAEGSTLLLCKTHYLKRFKEGGAYLGDEKFKKTRKGKPADGSEQPPPPAAAEAATSVAASAAEKYNEDVDADADADVDTDAALVVPASVKPAPTTSKGAAKGASSTKVRVCVRCRPLTIREARGRRCLAVQADHLAVGDKVRTT